MNVRAVTGTGKVAGQSRDGIDVSEGAVLFVVLERRHRRVEFTDHVKILAARMKCEMARSGAGLEFGERLFAGRELSGGAIEVIDQHLIDTEICGEGMTLRAIEDDAVRVWSFLLFLGSGTFVLLNLGDHSQRSIRTYRQHAHVAASVICDEERSFLLIDSQITRVCALSRLFIQQTQISELVDGVSTDAATRLSEKVADLIHCIQKSPARVDR